MKEIKRDALGLRPDLIDFQIQSPPPKYTGKHLNYSLVVSA